MNAEELAALLNGIEYDGVTKEHTAIAKENGLVIVYGASDDLMEFRGAICDELSAFNGTRVFLSEKGLIVNRCKDEDCPYHMDELKKGVRLYAKWHDQGNPCWTYETKIPYEMFRMFDDGGELYCVGIVFALKDIPEVRN
jgi:hypothetical protein